jgi:hypothetical protein
MEKETLKNILDFLKEKEGKSSIRWKLLHNEPFTEEELNVDGKFIFDGFLDLSGKNITSLPKGLEVRGNLYLRNCKSLTSLPEGLSVWGTLDLKGSTIKSLPEGLLLGGLNLTNCKSLTSLPEGMKVGRGGLNLTNCKSLTSLPKGLKVGENLYIKNSPLAKFSDESLKDMIGLNGYIKGKIVR